MNRPLLLILILSAVLAAGYAWATPFGAAPDEGAHFQYVKVLATEHRLPALNLTQKRQSHADPDYESHQGPLYYLLAVPFHEAGRLAAGDRGAQTACRVLSILLGLAGTLLVLLLARELAPDRPALQLAAAGFAALLPMRLAIMASVSNDMAAEVTTSLALLLMLRALRGDWSVRQAGWLGGAIGLALLAKSSGILLLPPALLAIYLASKRPPEPPEESVAPASHTPAAASAGAGKRPRSRRLPAVETQPTPGTSPDEERAAAVRFLTTGAVVGIVIALIAGWWFVRNHLLYGDPLGQKAFNWYFEDTTRWEEFKNRGWSFGRYLSRLVLPTTFATFWGAFGHLERPELFMGTIGPGYPPRSWVYPPLLILTLIAVGGGIRWYLRERRLGSTQLGILVLHAVFVVAAFFNFNATYFQGQGRYLFPAIGVLSLGLAGGWLEWGRSRERILASVIEVFMLALALYALFGVLVPAF